MRDNIKELVTYIRSVHEWCARTKSGGDWFAIDPDESPFKAADALEALAGEVVRVTKERDEARAMYLGANNILTITGDARKAAEAERDRMKAEYDAYRETSCEIISCLKSALLDIKHFGAGFAQDRARKALGDAL